MGRTVEMGEVQRAGPFDSGAARRRVFVRFEQIAPVIRIAHRRHGPLRIPTRIIFDHEIVLIQEGRGLLTIGGAAHRYEPGTLLYLAPFVAHEFGSPEAGSGAHIAVHFDYSAAVPGAVEFGREAMPYAIFFPAGARIETFGVVSPGHWVETMLREIVGLHAADDPLSAADASARLTTVVLQLMRWGLSGGCARGAGVADASVRVNRLRIADVVAFIDRNLTAPLSVGSLAQIAGLGRSRFAAVFREIVGESAQRYVERRRIAEARRLLTDVTFSIKQISAMVGFEDPLYFSRAFRRIDGLSPSQYRAAALAASGLLEAEKP